MKKVLLASLFVLLSLGRVWAQTLTVSPSTNVYNSTGGEIVFTVALSFPAAGTSPSGKQTGSTVVAFAAKPSNAGWEFVSSGGSNTTFLTEPDLGDTTVPDSPDSSFGWSYANTTVLSAGQASFTFVLKYPAGLTGPQSIAFSGHYRFYPVNGMGEPDLSVDSRRVDYSAVSPLTIVPKIAPFIIAQPTLTAAAYAVGSPFSLTVNASGSPAPSYEWRKDNVAINPMTNSSAVTSTLTIPSVQLSNRGAYTVVITNQSGTITSTPLTPTIYLPIAINTPPTTQTVAAGGTATFTVGATGDPIAYQWYRNSVPLSGATNATLSLPNLPLNGGGTISVRISNGITAPITSEGALLTVNPPAPVFAAGTASTATAVQNRAFSFPVTLNTSVGASFTATGLPAGLTINTATGTISGIPTATGTTPITINVTNPSGNAAFTLTLTVVAPPPVISSPASTSGQVGQGFTFTVVGSNATSYSATGLDAIGLSINPSTGVISGSPTASGTFTVQVTVTNSGGSVTQPLVITIARPPNAPVYAGTLTPSFTAGSNAVVFTPPFGTVTQPYSLTGTLPTGLGFNAATGVISGTPTQTGSFPITLSATNAGGTTAVALTIIVNASPSAPRITNATTITGRQWSGLDPAVPGTFQVLSEGTPAATSYAATGLPNGVTINAAGLISGTPTVFGTFNASIAASNTLGAGPAANFVFVIAPHAGAPVITSDPVAPGKVGEAFSYQLTTDKAAQLYTVTNGTLPTGLTLDTSTGLISGTPGAGTAGQTRVWIKAAANANGSTDGPAAEILFVITPATSVPVVSSNGTANAQVGQPFLYVITATSGTTITSFGTSNRPDWLGLDAATGVLSGIPSEATTTPIEIGLMATNAGGTSAPKTLLLTVAPAPATPEITSALSASGRSGQTFSYQIDASQGPITSFAVTGLPDGLALAAGTSGQITGTPTVSGTFSVTLRAANAAGLGRAATLELSIAPAAAAPSITSAAAVSTVAGDAFTYSITATSAPILSYAVVEGTTMFSRLPTGLTFNSATGVISGNAASPGLYTVSLTATNAGGTSFPQALSINVRPRADMPVVTSAQYATARVNENFTYFITATHTTPGVGGFYTPPESFDAVNLPEGLAINSASGKIFGQPTRVGTSIATLIAYNAAGQGPARDLTITVLPSANAPVVGGAADANGQVGVAFSYQIVASENPTSYEVLDAPAWLTLNSTTGTITGTPTAPGSISVRLVATNAAGSSEPVPVTFHLSPAADTPVITSPRIATGRVGTTFSYTTTVSTGTAAFTPLSFSAAGIPPGLSINPTTGAITGRPSASGTYFVRITPTNSKGIGAPVILEINIAASVTFGSGN